MKGFILTAFLILSLFSGHSNLFSQVWLVENFDYTAGDSLGAHGWVSFSGGATNVLTVTLPGLTYTGYPGSGVGNAVSLNASGQDAYKPLSSIDSVNSFYCAAMFNVATAQAGDYVLAFLPSTSTTFYSGRVHVRASGSGISFGITKGAATDTTTPGIWTTGTYNFGTTYIVVLKYSFVEGSNNDLVSLFVFDSAIPSIEPTPTVGPLTYPSGDAFNLGRVALRQGTASRAPTLKVDGIRVTRSWGSIITSVVNQTGFEPENFALYQNYPNPFNPATKISFSLPVSGMAKLNVYDNLGRTVSSLVNGNLNAGRYEYDFRADGISSGVYYYRLDFTGSNGDFRSETRKLLIAK